MNHIKRWVLAGLSAVLLTGGLAFSSAVLSTPTPAGASCTGIAGTLTITVCGNQFITQAGFKVQLRGANTEGTQYDCAQTGSGFNDDTGITENTFPTLDSFTTSINAMKAWGINTVRINLNEECWLGINGVPTTTSQVKQGTSFYPLPTGDTYQAVDTVNAYENYIGQYVAALTTAGIYSEIDLHLNAPGTGLIKDAGSNDFQNPLPDTVNSVNFWNSVASYFSASRSVVFGAFNEPFPNNYNSNGDTTAFWNAVEGGATIPHNCTSSVGNCSGASYTADGMSQMITAIRAYNTTAPILVGGPDFAGDMDEWLNEYYPGGVSIDPDNLLAASVHIYFPGGNSPCTVTTTVSTACPAGIAGGSGAGAITAVAAKAPVVVDELGDFTCTSGESTSTSLKSFINSIETTDYLTGTNIGYIGWAWTTSGCDPNLITSYSTGAPSPMGEIFYCRLYLNSMNNGSLVTTPATTCSSVG